MNRETLILGFEHELILKEFLLFAAKEFGVLKMNEIIKKINSSGKVPKFLMEANRINLRLGSDDFLGCIHASSSFMFSKAETICIAAIVLLKKWNHEIGKPNGLTDDIYLNERFFSILDKCDTLRTHLKSTSNFFDRFTDHLDKILTLSIVKNCIQTIKTEIAFDSLLCDAIIREEKTEFRVVDNLEGINFKPSEWKHVGFDIEKGAEFSSEFIGETVFVENPYKLGSYVSVFNSSNSSKVHSQIKITSCYIQRIRQVNQSDAVNEGYGAYKEKIEILFTKDPSLNAELCLFEEDWIEKYGRGSFASNVWLWVFEFEIIKQIRALGSTEGLSEEEMIALIDSLV